MAESLNNGEVKSSYAKFSIGSKELKKIVSQLTPMFKGGFEATPRVLFRVGDRVKVFATNSESYTEIVFDCNIQSQGEFVVSGEKFSEIIRSGIDGNNVELSILDNNSLMITDGLIDYRIALIDSNVDYLEAPDINDAKSFSINAQELKSALSSVSCCIDQAKAHLNCVMVHTDSEKKNQLNIVATDGMRLGVVERKAIYDVEVPNLMIPKKAADYILTIIGDMSGEITIKYTDNMIQLSTGSILYTSKLLDTNFPKYQSVIPISNNKILEAKVADMREAIKQTSSMMEITFRIKMNIEADKVRISCEDNGDTAKGEFAATYSQTEPMEIICNFKLLMDILEKISSTDVRIQIMDPTTPLLIRSVSDETIRYVFMPFVSQ